MNVRYSYPGQAITILDSSVLSTTFRLASGGRVGKFSKNEYWFSLLSIVSTTLSYLSFMNTILWFGHLTLQKLYSISEALFLIFSISFIWLCKIENRQGILSVILNEDRISKKKKLVLLCLFNFCSKIFVYNNEKNYLFTLP